MEINLTFRPPRRLRISPNRRVLKRLVHRAAELAGLPVREDYALSLRFISDRAMAAANAEFVGHSGTTDVITFSYLDAPDSLFPGDVAVELLIGLEVAEREGAERGNSSFAAELTLYLVHGFLHAAGEDDLSPLPRRRMRRREREVMTRLKAEFDLEAIFSVPEAAAAHSAGQ